MNSNPIVLHGLGATGITLSEEAEKQRDTLLAEATQVTEVTDAFTAEVATDTLRQLKAMSRLIEDARKEVKAPVLELTRKIDALAKGFSVHINEEAVRLAQLIGAYQAAEREKTQRARKEAEEQVRKERAKAIEEAAKAETVEQYEAAVEKGAMAVAKGRAEVANLKSNEPKGTSLRKRWCFEVQDIDLLYKTHPGLVRLEPDGDAIRAMLKIKQDIPGLRVWEIATTSIR